MTTHITIAKMDGIKGREQVVVAEHTDRIYADAQVHGLLEQHTRRPASNLRNYEVMVLTRRQASDLYRQLRKALYTPHKG